jgi:hypothetical protein
MEIVYQLIAVSWMLAGGFIICNPRYLGRRLTRRGSRRLRALLFAIALYLCGTILALSRDLDPPWNIVLTVVAVVGVFKAVSLLKASMAAALGRFAQRMPSLVLRIGGVCYVAFGIWIFLHAGPKPTDADVPIDTGAIEELEALSTGR